MSHLSENPYNWDLDKKSENVPVIEYFDFIIVRIYGLFTKRWNNIMNTQFQNVYMVKNYLISIFCQMSNVLLSKFESLLKSYFGKHFIALKSHLSGVFLSLGSEKMVPVSDSPSYPGSHLSEVHLLRKGYKNEGTEKNSTT